MSSMGNPVKKLMTAAEYLDMERNSPEKHEFYFGEIYAMAGAKENHNLIVSNLISLIHLQFKGRPCYVYPSDLRVVIDEYSHYVYPDLVLVCGERKFLDKSNDSLLNPSAVIEVLSDSTETYDRGKKFESYRNIISLQEYVLVSSGRKKIELFSKSAEGKWVLSESGKEGTLDILSLNLHLSASDVYDKIQFEN